MHPSKYEQQLYDLYTLYPEVKKMEGVTGDDDWYRYQVEAMMRYTISKAGKWDAFYASVFVKTIREDLVKSFGERLASGVIDQ